MQQIRRSSKDAFPTLTITGKFPGSSVCYTWWHKNPTTFYNTSASLRREQVNKEWCSCPFNKTFSDIKGRDTIEEWTVLRRVWHLCNSVAWSQELNSLLFEKVINNEQAGMSRKWVCWWYSAVNGVRSIWKYPTVNPTGSAPQIPAKTVRGACGSNLISLDKNICKNKGLQKYCLKFFSALGSYFCFSATSNMFPFLVLW